MRTRGPRQVYQFTDNWTIVPQMITWHLIVHSNETE